MYHDKRQVDLPHYSFNDLSLYKRMNLEITTQKRIAIDPHQATGCVKSVKDGGQRQWDVSA